MNTAEALPCVSLCGDTKVQMPREGSYLPQGTVLRGSPKPSVPVNCFILSYREFHKS